MEYIHFPNVKLMAIFRVKKYTEFKTILLFHFYVCIVLRRQKVKLTLDTQSIIIFNQIRKKRCNTNY